MNTKNILIALLVFATAGASLVAWQQYTRWQVAQAQAEGAAADRAELRKKLWDAEKRAGDLERDLAAARRHGSAASASSAGDVPADAASDNPPPPPADATASGHRRSRGEMAAAMKQLMADPEFVRAMNLNEMARLNSRYGDLFRQLNLSPARLEKFKELLVERQNAGRDVMTAAMSEGLDPRQNGEQLQALVRENQAEVDASIKAALGDAAYQQYQSYDQTAPQRQVVSTVNDTLAQPLSTTKQLQLVNLLAQSSSAQVAAASTGTFPGPHSAVTITDDIIAQAQGFLSADELAALKTVQAQQEAAALVAAKMREAMPRPPPQ